MEFSLEISSGLKLIGDIHEPADKPAEVIVLFHGIGDHIGRYSDWASRFTEKGSAVLGVDLPGHGRSPGKRGHIQSYHVYNDIIDSLAKYIRLRYGKIPIGLYGHSMGGNIILNYLLTNYSGFDFGIATSSWLKLVSPPADIKVAIARLVNRILPGLLQSNGLNLEHISRAEDVYEKYDADPLVHNRISVRLAIEATDAAKRILDTGRDIDVPVLLLHGEDDKITSSRGSSMLADSNSNISLRIWQNGYHELHNEEFNDEVFDYIYSWLHKTIR